MQILKTLGWIVLTALVISFVMINYGEKHDVIIWPTSNDALVFNWPVGIIALVFWLLGVIPALLFHRGVKWSLDRRIRALENSIKSSAMAARRNGSDGDKSAEKPGDSTPDAQDGLTSLSKSGDGEPQ